MNRENRRIYVFLLAFNMKFNQKGSHGISFKGQNFKNTRILLEGGINRYRFTKHSQSGVKLHRGMVALKTFVLPVVIIALK